MPASRPLNVFGSFNATVAPYATTISPFVFSNCNWYGAVPPSVTVTTISPLLFDLHVRFSCVSVAVIDDGCDIVTVAISNSQANVLPAFSFFAITLYVPSDKSVKFTFEPFVANE